MVELTEQLVAHIESLGVLGGLIGCIFIVIESILPIIPLFVFITLNFICFGDVFGFLMSWFFTVIGCILSYSICKKGLSDKYYKKIKEKEKLSKYTEKFKNIKFGSLSVLVAIPFTPAFLINIAAGLSKMDFKKYLFALLIGKIALVYFWGYVGTSLLESISDPITLLRISALLLITYILSIITNKVLKL